MTVTRRCGRWRALWRLRKAKGSRATSPEHTPGERTANCDNKGNRTSRRLAARRRARRAVLGVRPRIRTWCAPPRAGARVRGWSEGVAQAERRTGREKTQGGGGEEHAARKRPCSTAAVKNHPQRTCGDMARTARETDGADGARKDARDVRTARGVMARTARGEMAQRDGADCARRDGADRARRDGAVGTRR